jgi:anti-anti-sigma factor
MIQTCEPDKQILFHFEGHLDTAKCMEIQAEVRGTITASSLPVVFDLGKVVFVSSSFLRMCIYAYQQAGERGFRIVGASPYVKRVFKIAGLDKILNSD